MKQKTAAVAAQYSAQNRQCATLIIQNPERYGGANSLMMRWARMVLDPSRRESTQNQPPANRAGT